MDKNKIKEQLQKNDVLTKIILKPYLFFKKIQLQIHVLDYGINQILKYPYKKYPTISVNTANTLIDLYHKYYRDLEG